MPLGGIISILIFAPNLLFMFYPPLDAAAARPLVKDRNFRIMEVIEWVGRIGCLVIPFFYAISFSDIGSILAGAVMALAYVGYLAGWLRYMRGGRRGVLLFQPLWGLAQPMVIWPVIYFWAAAVVLNSFWLLLAALILMIGHLYMSNKEYRRWK